MGKKIKDKRQLKKQRTEEKKREREAPQESESEEEVAGSDVESETEDIAKEKDEFSRRGAKSKYGITETYEYELPEDFEDEDIDEEFVSGGVEDIGEVKVKKGKVKEKSKPKVDTQQAGKRKVCYPSLLPSHAVLEDYF